MRVLVAAGILGCSIVAGVALAAPPKPAPLGVDEGREQPRRRPAAGDELLAFVPADAPYVLAVLEPAPRGLLRRIEPVLAPLRQAVQRELDAVDPDDLPPEVRVLVEALDGRVSAEGLRELGIDANPRLVVYGLGLAPVVRIRLHDGPRLHALLRRIDAADGEPWPIWAHAEVSGWRIEEGETALAWGIVGDDLVATAYPRSLEAEILPLAFGARRPARSLAAEGWATAMRREHGLVSYGLGRVDLLALTEAVTGSGSGLLAASVRAWDLEVDEDEPCTAAARHLARRAPELVTGLTELSDDAVAGRWTWRMDEALVSDLAALAGPIPRTADGVATAGFSLDMARAEATARGWLEELHRVAPECVPADAWRGVALPTAIASLRSGAATLHEYDRKTAEPSYTLVLGLAEPERWLAAVLPELSLRDWPKRRPVPAREVLESAESIDEAFVARTEDGIALASGERARAHARKAARVKGRDDDVLARTWIGLGALRRAIPPRTLEDTLAGSDAIERALVEGVLGLLGDYEARLVVEEQGLTAEWTLELR